MVPIHLDHQQWLAVLAYNIGSVEVRRKGCGKLLKRRDLDCGGITERRKTSAYPESKIEIFSRTVTECKKPL
jgi:hypothetical protein